MIFATADAADRSGEAVRGVTAIFRISVTAASVWAATANMRRSSAMRRMRRRYCGRYSSS